MELMNNYEDFIIHVMKYLESREHEEIKGRKVFKWLADQRLYDEAENLLSNLVVYSVKSIY